MEEFKKNVAFATSFAELPWLKVCFFCHFSIGFEFIESEVTIYWQMFELVQQHEVAVAHILFTKWQ